ncbi:MAG: hypothetical protein LBV71_16175 [Prevotella sp.]|jgi:hypothetical protein|nr:hypothetical protein [Prevotella sp.]
MKKNTLSTEILNYITKAVSKTCTPTQFMKLFDLSSYTDISKNDVEEWEMFHHEVYHTYYNLWIAQFDTTKDAEDIVDKLTALEYKEVITNYINSELDDYESFNHWAMDWYLIKNGFDVDELVNKMVNLAILNDDNKVEYQYMPFDAVADECMDIFIDDYNFDREIAWYKAYGVIGDIFEGFSKIIKSQKISTFAF